jgi:beta-glucosidase
VTVSVDLTNIGDRAGSELVQLYVRSPKSKVARPDKELRAFAKLSLQPGETGTAVLKVLPRDLAYFDPEAGAFRAEPGDYQLVIAANAIDIKSVVGLRSPASYLLPPSHA